MDERARRRSENPAETRYRGHEAVREVHGRGTPPAPANTATLMAMPNTPPRPRMRCWSGRLADRLLAPTRAPSSAPTGSPSRSRRRRRSAARPPGRRHAGARDQRDPGERRPGSAARDHRGARRSGPTAPGDRARRRTGAASTAAAAARPPAAVVAQAGLQELREEEHAANRATRRRSPGCRPRTPASGRSPSGSSARARAAPTRRTRSRAAPSAASVATTSGAAPAGGVAAHEAPHEIPRAPAVTRPGREVEARVGPVALRDPASTSGAGEQVRSGR